MENIASLIVKLFVVLFGFAVLTSVIFIWVLPDIPHWSRSYLSFSLGSICAALLSGHITFQSAQSLTSTTNQFLLASICGLVIGAINLLVTLFVVANIKGL